MDVEKKSKKILIVEDEPDIRELIVLHLKRLGYGVDAVSSSEDAIQRLDSASYDLLVVDWMLPGVAGVDLVRQQRGRVGGRGFGVLMLTAKDQPEDIVAGLEAGADDYLVKPFDSDVLQARVRALLRRVTASDSSVPSERMSFGELTIDSASVEVQCGGAPIHLTRSEFRLLETMARHAGRVLTRDTLIRMVQGEGVSVVDRAIDTHIFGLRKKLGKCADVVETIRGVGYRVRG